MAQSYDGTFSTPIQHGAKQVSIPLQGEGNYYATIIKRNYIAAPATKFETILPNRTNYSALLKYSDDLSKANWTKAQTTAATGYADPEGGLTASYIAETATTNVHNVNQSVGTLAGNMSLGVYAKAGTRRYLRVRIQNPTDGNAGYAVFDLLTGIIVGTSVGTCGIGKLLNGWYWCHVTTDVQSDVQSAFFDISNDGTTFSYLGAVAYGLYLWRATMYQSIAIGPAVATTVTTRAVTVPPVDVDDPSAFLISEQEPDMSMLEIGIARWGREYANVPRETTVQTSITLTKPSISGTFPQAFGNFRIFQPDTTLLRYDAYAALTVTSDTGIPGYVPTGGSYTITFAGYTTGILNYNDTAGTVQTALNGLTSVSNRGNVVVTGSYNAAGGFVVTFNAYAQITIASGSLTGGTISKTESVLNNGYSQIVAAYIAGSFYPLLYPNDVNITGLVYTGGAILRSLSIVAFDSGPGIAYIYGSTYPYNTGTFTGGTFTTTISGVTSSPIAYNATIQEVQNAFDAIAPGKYLISSKVISSNLTYTTYFGDRILSTDYTQIAYKITIINLPPTGGTYTLTAFTQTTAAISYSATSATVAGALNDAAMTGVLNRGGCTVTGDLVKGFTIAFLNADITNSPALLTPTGSGCNTINIDGGIGRIQRVTFTNPTSIRDIYIANHGLSIEDTLYIRATSGPTYYSRITSFSIPDANTIRFITKNSDTWSAVVAIEECGKRTKQNYEPGSSSIKALRITTFYLPGFTIGINSASQIMIPQNQSDGVSLLLAILSGVDTINARVGEILRWRSSDILMLEKITVQSIDI